MPVFEYVSTFHEHLHKAWEIAKQHLVDSQSRMKTKYDKKCVVHSFQPGDSVLVLLPVSSSPMHAWFSGPYKIEKKLSDTNYTVLTPDQRRKSRVCHINMLKAYFARDKSDVNPVIKSVSVVNAVDLPSSYVSEEDDLTKMFKPLVEGFQTLLFCPLCRLISHICPRNNAMISLS